MELFDNFFDLKAETIESIGIRWKLNSAEENSSLTYSVSSCPVFIQFEAHFAKCAPAKMLGKPWSTTNGNSA